MEETTQKRKFNILGFLKETVETILTALVLTGIIYYFIATPNEVKGASMLPNVYEGELILTNRVRHHLGATPIGKKFDWNYKRGEIVIFKLPYKEPYIKRIVALPGDEITLNDGYLVVNGKKVMENYIDHDKIPTKPGDFIYDGRILKVPDNSYAVFGDNRSNSLDSRYNAVGFVPRQYITGPAAFRVLPLNRIGFFHKGEYHEVDIPEDMQDELNNE